MVLNNSVAVPFSIHESLTVLCLYIDGLMQERRNSIANALELRRSCTNPSTCACVYMLCAMWQIYTLPFSVIDVTMLPNQHIYQASRGQCYIEFLADTPKPK